MVVIMNFIIVPRCPGIFDQLPGRGLFHEGRNLVADFQVIIVHCSFGHGSFPRYSRMMPVLRPLATTSPRWFLKVSSVITNTMRPVRPLRSLTSAYLAVSVIVSPAQIGR